MKSGRRPPTGPSDRSSKSAKRPARVRSAAAATPPSATEPATASAELAGLAAYRERFPQDRPPRWTSHERPPIDYFLRLFDDPEFWRDTFACYGAVGDVVEQGLSDEAIQQAWQEIRKPFRHHYHAEPALQFLPVHYRQGFSAVAGHWGVVPVYPWTKDDEIKAAVRSIRKKIGQTRGDAEKQKHAALGVWLKLHGFTAAEVAAALGTPSAGDRPRDLRTQRPVAGSEPPLDAWLRVTRGRLREVHARLQADFREPVSVDPLTDALTAVLRCGVFPGPANLEDLAAAVARLHDVLGARPLL
jgi:hypothetical protein